MNDNIKFSTNFINILNQVLIDKFFTKLKIFKKIYWLLIKRNFNNNNIAIILYSGNIMKIKETSNEKKAAVNNIA